MGAKVGIGAAEREVERAIVAFRPNGCKCHRGRIGVDAVRLAGRTDHMIAVKIARIEPVAVNAVAIAWQEVVRGGGGRRSEAQFDGAKRGQAMWRKGLIVAVI